MRLRLGLGVRVPAIPSASVRSRNDPLTAHLWWGGGVDVNRSLRYRLDDSSGSRLDRLTPRYSLRHESRTTRPSHPQHPYQPRNRGKLETLAIPQTPR